MLEIFYLNTHEFFISRDAVFIENNFPFSTAHKPTYPPVLEPNFGENSWASTEFSSLERPIARGSDPLEQSRPQQ